MTILYADGFELGTTLAEANLMSGNAWTQSSFVNATSTFTFGASTMGQGRSLTMAMFGTSTTTTNRPALTLPVNFDLANAPVGYKFSFGIRAKLNPNKTNAASSYFMLRDSVGTGANIGSFILSTSSITSAGSAVMQYALGVSGTGTFTVPDLNAHYYTFSHVKLATNSYACSVYLDNNLVASFTGVTSLITTPVFGFMQAGTTATIQANMFSEVDDIYFSANEEPLGNMRIRRITPISDVQAQWTRIGTAPNNHASVDNIGLTATNHVEATTSKTDIYGTATAEDANYQVVAVKATAVGNGSPSDTLTAQFKVGATIVASAPKALAATDVAISTEWNTSLAVPDLTQLQFGMSKV